MDVPIEIVFDCLDRIGMRLTLSHVNDKLLRVVFTVRFFLNQTVFEEIGTEINSLVDTLRWNAPSKNRNENDRQNARTHSRVIILVGCIRFVYTHVTSKPSVQQTPGSTEELHDRKRNALSRIKRTETSLEATPRQMPYAT